MRLEFCVMSGCLRRGPTRSIYIRAADFTDLIDIDTKTGEVSDEKFEKKFKSVLKMSAPAKPAKKPAKPAEHPTYIEMISAAIIALKERNGSSRQAILKYISANYKVNDSAATHVRMALKKGVSSGRLNQTKGTGASGSFKVNKVAKPAEKKPKAKKPAKPKTAAKKPAAKTKKSTPKSPAKKKASAKKSTTKPKPGAKKPAAKKAGSPKKAKKPAAKKPAAKKPKPAKKPAGKKPAKKTGKK